MLTSHRWISKADRYLLEDMVRFGGMYFPYWIFIGKVGITFGRMDFWLC